jgi:hypothetical protein
MDSGEPSLAVVYRPMGHEGCFEATWTALTRVDDPLTLAFVRGVTQLGTRLRQLSVRGISASQFTSPGAGMTLPAWQINCGSPGGSGVGAVTRGRRLSALVDQDCQ